MNTHTLKTKKLLLASLVMAALHQGSVSAQETENTEKARSLEKITVTSLKRTQSLDEVPMSVSAVNMDKIESAGIERLEDLATYIPNFSISRDAIADRINIRGMQSGTQAGFEQSVGTFVNGIYRGRGTQARFSFMDVERVEVMRGPQSILFGKNTVAGALNITTAKPDEDLNGFFSIAQNFEHDQTELNGMITGALTDDLRARVFLLSKEMNEGWVHNNFYDKGTPQSDEKMGRLTVEWDASDRTMLTFMLEKSDFDIASFPQAMYLPGPLAAFGAETSYTTSNIGNTSSAMNFGSPQQMSGEATEFLVTSETNYDSGTLTVTAGTSRYDFLRDTDVDYSALDGLRFSDAEDFEQDSIELRFASNTGGKFEFMTGLYWQQQKMMVDGLSMFNVPVLQQVLKGGCAAGLGAAFGDIYVGGDVGATGAGVIQAGGPAGLVNACGTAAAFEGLPFGVSRYARLDQETDTLGIFAQGTYNFSDDLRATFGLRYTEEEKRASKVSFAADLIAENRTITTNPVVQAVSEQLGEFITHEFSPSDPGMTRDESSPDWALNVQYDMNDDTMTYVTASTGFKSGGYNSFYMKSGNTLDSRDVAFEDENVLAFEIGMKTELLDGAADLNIAAFHSTFDDIQVAVFSGNTTFEVQNAAKATSSGIEIDGRYRATDALTLTAAIGLLNFEYDEFPNQACTSLQFVTARQAAFDAAADIPSKIGVGMGYNNAACANAGTNDMSGRTSSLSPDTTASLAANHIAEFGDYELVSNLDINYRSAIHTVDDLDPLADLPAQTFVNGSITLNQLEQGWSLTLIGKNLSDEQHFTYINDVPLFAGAHNFMPAPGRNWTLKFKYNFGE